MPYEQIAPAGLYYPNKIVRIFINAIDQVLGKQALTDILKHYQLEKYLEALPPNNLNRQVDFSEFSMLNAGIHDVVGDNDAIKAKIGATCYSEGLKSFGALAGVGGVAMSFRVMPLWTRVKIGMQSMSGIFTTFSDQTTEVEEVDDYFVYRIHKCPICWGRKSDGHHDGCAMAGGLLEAGLRWATDTHDFKVTETKCRMKGDSVCEFKVEIVE